MIKLRSDIVVLGAGLAGASIALELATQGASATLVDQDAVALNRASLRNEGKIHLGIIYAQDASRETARLQLTGALRFRSLLRRWLGAAADRMALSTPFVYLVAKDSIMPAAELEVHYAAVESIYREQLALEPALDYLGGRPEALYRRCDVEELATHFRVGRFSAAFRTEERAIDTAELAFHFRRVIAQTPSISFLPNRTVTAVTRHRTGFHVTGTGSDGPWRMDASRVVNALGENRLAIDRSVGLVPQAGWLYRRKFRVIAKVPPELRAGPSVTMVIGRYGDVVIRPDGTAYLSWYPAGLKGWTHELAPPGSWNDACKGLLSPEERESIPREIIDAIETWYPGIGRSIPVQVDAGVIIAYGHTDVDDRSSGLHHRTRIGVTSADGYHSVEPGKLTTAPLFAKIAADRILEHAL